MVYRLYFNSREAAPWHWCFDKGTVETEVLLVDFVLHNCTAKSKCNFLATEKDGKEEPSGWLEVEASAMKVLDGVGHFYGKVIRL